MENNDKEHKDSFIKRYAEKKNKKFKRKLIVVLAPLLIILLIISAVLLPTIGFMGDNTIDDKVSAATNNDLDYYTKESVAAANGPMDDYYGFAKKLALTKGNVIAYMRWEEVCKGKDSDQYGQGNTSTDRTENVIDNIINKLKPDFTYTTGTITTIRKYKAFDTSRISNLQTYDCTPGGFSANSANNYNVGTDIYMYKENLTYTVVNKQVEDISAERQRNNSLDNQISSLTSNKNTAEQNEKDAEESGDYVSAEAYANQINNDQTQITNLQNQEKATINKTIKDFNITGGTPNELNGYQIIEFLPSKFNANKYNVGDKLFVIGNNMAYTVVPKTDTSKQSIKLLSHAVTFLGTFNITYQDNTVTYTENVDDPDKDGVYTVTRPIVKEHKEIDKPYDPLKKQIKAENPGEDIPLATAFVVNNSSGYDNKSQDGNWINDPVDQFNLDELFDDGSCSFQGLIPLFLQADARWGSYPYEGKNIAEGGCGITCMAMVATGLEGNYSAYDLNHDGMFDPEESAKFSTDNGFAVPGEGTSWGYFPFAASKFGLTCTQYDVSQYSSVLSELKAGHPVIASMGPGHFTKGGHFIVLTGVNSDGKITVNDPASQERSNETWDFNSIIVPEAVQFWSFNNPNLKFDFEATAYDLSYASNQKSAGDSGYGVTANGTNLSGKSIKDKDRYIAVDPSVIRLGSSVYIAFPANARYITLIDGTRVDLNGTYTAVDTGGAIKGHHIDIFMGENLNSIYPNWTNPHVHVRVLK